MQARKSSTTSVERVPVFDSSILSGSTIVLHIKFKFEVWQLAIDVVARLPRPP
jgi:hypothetical protein